MRKITIELLRLGEEPILAGRLSGRRAFVEALGQVPTEQASVLIVLNFAGIELATSSFLNEMVLPLREHLRLRRPAGYVMVANLNQQVHEEFEELLRRSGDALLVASDITLSVDLVGNLDQKLQETFDLVRSKTEATASELYSETGDAGIGPTGWNNRLSALASKSLLYETTEGRTKRYRILDGEYDGR